MSFLFQKPFEKNQVFPPPNMFSCFANTWEKLDVTCDKCLFEEWIDRSIQTNDVRCIWLKGGREGPVSIFRVHPQSSPDTSIRTLTPSWRDADSTCCFVTCGKSPHPQPRRLNDQSQMVKTFKCDSSCIDVSLQHEWRMRINVWRTRPEGWCLTHTHTNRHTPGTGKMSRQALGWRRNSHTTDWSGWLRWHPNTRTKQPWERWDVCGNEQYVFVNRNNKQT